MNWEKTQLITEQGEKVNAQAPVIVSASRATDIPAFYANWFIERWKKGYIKWKNPFNGVSLYVSFEKTRILIFWSKNPKQIIKHLDYLDEKHINYYFQFTLNDYDKEKLEVNVPNLNYRIETFIELSERITKEKLIWRFDPYIITDSTSVDELLKRTEYIGDRLKNYTNKLVFSFADIKTYRKVQINLRRDKIKYHEFNERTMIELAKGLKELNKKWDFEVGTCAEKIDLDKYGIVHTKCIDDDLIIKLFSHDEELMDLLGVKFNSIPSLFDDNKTVTKTKVLKDKGQREACGCIMSKDIGQYNTCPHECVYCYANTSKEIAIKNYKAHKVNPNSETITGE